MPMTPTSRVYLVTWHVHCDETVHVTRVAITKGYSTLQDIPRIIAVSRTGSAALADYVTVDSVCLDSETEG